MAGIEAPIHQVYIVDPIVTSLEGRDDIHQGQPLDDDSRYNFIYEAYAHPPIKGDVQEAIGLAADESCDPDEPGRVFTQYQGTATIPSNAIRADGVVTTEILRLGDHVRIRLFDQTPDKAGEFMHRFALALGRIADMDPAERPYSYPIREAHPPLTY